MAPSQNFFDLVEHFEGLKLTAYQDIAGVWTIGYGTTHYPNGDPVLEGDTCTIDEAKDYLNDHVAGIQLPPDLSQSEYDSCLDFCYNVGIGAWNSSTLKKDVVNQAESSVIETDFCMWDKAHHDGQLVEVDGLLRRRKCEAYLYINGENATNFLN